jgi:hypothetical protein
LRVLRNLFSKTPLVTLPKMPLERAYRKVGPYALSEHFEPNIDSCLIPPCLIPNAKIEFAWALPPPRN